MSLDLLLWRAEEIARSAHKNDKRRDGSPYVNHLWAVVEAVDGDYQKMVAWLHDTVEDHPETHGLDYLREQGMPKRVVDNVFYLTRKPLYSYFDYIKVIGDHPIAAVVKLADLAHNLSTLPAPPELRPLWYPPQPVPNAWELRTRDKYLFAQQYLRSLR